MVAANITRFRELVFSDSAMTLQLHAITEQANFIAAVIDIASANGIFLSEPDIAAAINVGARNWFERWI